MILSMIFSILAITAPLLLITLGALASEYAGRLAMFMEHIINLGAFFCYAFTLATGNLFAGVLASVIVCTLTVVALEKTSAHFGANMFLVSLAMNLLFAALTTFFSVLAFKTRGVLFSDDFRYSAPQMRLVTSIIGYAASAMLIFFFQRTTPGLALRVTGQASEMLASCGIAVSRYRTLSWAIAASTGALAGCMYTMRLSSFVPGVAAGRGWTALAAVFLGRKHPKIVIVAVLVFAIAEYASTTIQNIPLFANVPSVLLLALPYLLSLLLIALTPTGSCE